MCRNMSSGYMAPSDSTVPTIATVNGPMLLARASENVITMAVPHSASTVARAARRGTIEHQRVIGFGKVIVRADLNRAIAAVGNGQRDGRPPGVELDIAIERQELAGNHGIG